MEKATLEKWVDELQAQIDQVKRDVQSIPAPEPVPDADGFVFACGHATMEISDVPYEESNDDEFARFAEYEFTDTFDTDNYDYFIGFDYRSTDVSSGIRYYGTAACIDLHDTTPLQSSTMPILSTVTSQGVETCAVAGTLKVDFVYGDTVSLGFVSEYGDGTGIAPDETGVTAIDYIIYAKKKPEETTRTKKRSKKK